MPLTPPPIDGRRYRELVDEALARIPVHTPEWTNFNDSDPGVTLLQLFAFVADSVLYRASLIPERNRLKFLGLLGVPLRPAAAARGVVTLTNERGPRETLVVPAGLALAAGPVPFVTTTGLDVLPVEARAYTRRAIRDPDELAAVRGRYGAVYDALRGDDGSEPEFYETVPFDPAAPALDLGASTVDGTLWLALLLRQGEEPTGASRAATRAALAGRTLTLGLLPALEAAPQTLAPGGTRAARPPAALRYDVSTTRTTAGAPAYAPLDARADADPLAELALVQLTLPGADDFGLWDDLDPLDEGTGDLPPALDDEALLARVVAWVRVRPPADAGGAGTAFRARFAWVGINAARVAQRVEVRGELLGTGTGAPDQALRLVNTPAIAETVSVSVQGERWRRIDDLLAAPPEVAPSGDAASTLPVEDARVFAVDRESGEVRFGDGLRGARPKAGALVVASYAYGGGSAGNVGADAIKAAPLLPAGFRVSNPVRTWGGDDGERVADAEREVPRWLRHRDRAVAADDYADIVRRTPGVTLGRVEVIPIYHPTLGAPTAGAVTVVVVPRDPANPQGPEPDLLALRAVCQHLEPHRVLTAEVHVLGPRYVDVSLSVGIEAMPGRDVAPVRDAVERALREFLSPLAGGPAGDGWPLDRAVEERELWVRAARVDGVSAVRGVILWDGGGARRAGVAIAGHDLPRLRRIAVRAGDPEETLDETPSAAPARRVPVPVVPAAC